MVASRLKGYPLGEYISFCHLPSGGESSIFLGPFNVGVWLSLVERFVRDEEVAGSNPVTPTIF